jgi:hypothetical protein
MHFRLKAVSLSGTPTKQRNKKGWGVGRAMKDYQGWRGNEGERGSCGGGVPPQGNFRVLHSVLSHGHGVDVRTRARARTRTHARVWVKSSLRLLIVLTTEHAPPTPMDDVPWVLVVRKQNTHQLCQHSNSDCVSEILLLCQHSNSDCVSNSDSVSEISLNHTDRCSELSEQELES